MEGKHWGELQDNTSNFTSPYLLSFDEIEKLSKEFVPCSSNKNLKSENVITTQVMPISYFEIDPIIQHNIQLVQYTKQMQEILQQLQQNYNKKYNSDNLPPVPIRPVKQHIQQHPSMTLTRRGVQQVLNRSVFQVCAHEGFDSTSESVLSVLTGVVEEMMIKFCNLLKINTERELLGRSTGFVDAMERTLHDIGMNGVKDLYDYHTNRVVRYNDRLRAQSFNLRRACVKVISQWDTRTDLTTTWTQEDSEWAEWSGNEGTDLDNSMNREMNEKSFSGSTSNNEAINQLHLEDNIVISAPGLESGLRMLYTLEQQEAMAATSGSLITHSIKEEENTSPAYGLGVDSASPSAGSARKNVGKKQRKS